MWILLLNPSSLKRYKNVTDPEFLRKIDNFDLLFLVETHLFKKMGSYYCNLICRPKTKANNRYFGGLAFLCKQSILRVEQVFFIISNWSITYKK
jgi:hypothetical protein